MADAAEQPDSSPIRNLDVKSFHIGLSQAEEKLSFYRQQLARGMLVSVQNAIENEQFPVQPKEIFNFLRECSIENAHRIVQTWDEATHASDFPVLDQALEDLVRKLKATVEAGSHAALLRALRGE